MSVVGIGLLVLAIACAYLASRRAEKFGYWSNWSGAAAVLCLAWLAWPNQPPVQPIITERQHQKAAADVAAMAYRILKEQKP